MDRSNLFKFIRPHFFDTQKKGSYQVKDKKQIIYLEHVGMHSMAAGFPRTFEIGRVFRNEGSSAEHLQEFTNLECYAAFMNIDEGKELVKDLYKALPSPNIILLRVLKNPCLMI